MGMGEVATIQAFDWAAKKPQCLVASNTIGRLVDDIMTHEVFTHICKKKHTHTQNTDGF